ncbi:SspB family protein [Luteithermobacter gelatinilyticus]|uniref:SspB family protein n=1 Tax=Luteithermobacter gelatinilyticus TaxID=2582913 RepID=UPI001106F870|nr:ClpXP protease specificity-enhancing factor SspB [Luteithermobacter gelatinilyticus]
MSDTVIQYDQMVQNALLSVVRDILTDTAKFGLPGNHHFYITFRTDYPDVKIPAYLKEKYPEEMTIVLQNQFWDLKTDEDHFEISLSFNRKREHLSVPFSALIGFFDPSVDFGLHFHSNELEDDEAEMGSEETGMTPPTPTSQIPSAQSTEDAAKEQPRTDKKKTDESATDNVVTLDSFRKK